MARAGLTLSASSSLSTKQGEPAADHRGQVSRGGGFGRGRGAAGDSAAKNPRGTCHRDQYCAGEGTPFTEGRLLKQSPEHTPAPERKQRGDRAYITQDG